MSCTTLLVGKNASYDGSTMIARNDDSGANGFTPKKFIVISSKEQKRKYKKKNTFLDFLSWYKKSTKTIIKTA